MTATGKSTGKQGGASFITRLPLPISVILISVYGVSMWLVGFLLQRLTPVQVEWHADGSLAGLVFAVPASPNLAAAMTAVHVLLAVFVAVDLFGRRRFLNRIDLVSCAFALILLGVLQVLALEIGA